MTLPLTARDRGRLEGKAFAERLPGFRPAFLYLNEEFKAGFEEGRQAVLSRAALPQADGDGRAA